MGHFKRIHSMKLLLFILTVSVMGILPANLPAQIPAVSLSRLDGAADWLNGRVNASGLDGKVVVLDVFTVDCSNLSKCGADPAVALFEGS